MICYKDQTWCPFWKECEDENKCGRAYTEQVQADVKKWADTFGEFKPGASVYMSKPKCFVQKK